MSTGGRIAVCPGTYDPVTYGHLDVIERAARLFDRVVVSIAEGSNTKQPMFTAEERKALLRQSVEHLGNVEVVGFNSLVTTHAREVGATVVVKGVRTAADFDYENQMTQFNRGLAGEIDSVLLPASPEWGFLSSSGVREAAAWGASVDHWVPPHVADALRDRLGSGRTA